MSSAALIWSYERLFPVDSVLSDDQIQILKEPGRVGTFFVPKAPAPRSVLGKRFGYKRCAHATC